MSANAISIHPVNVNDDITDRIRYPFPFVKNPYSRQVQDYVNDIMVDKQYRSLGFPEETLESCKGTNTAHITGWWYPTADYLRMIPLSRFMTWTMLNDDVYEQCTPEKIRSVKERSVAVFKGQMGVEEADILLGPQIDMMRRELLQFIPQESIDRFADEVQLYFEGIEMESPFRNGARYPTVDELLVFRRQSICMYPFVGLIEVETATHLPYEIYYHPHVRRFAILLSDLIARYNDAQSLFKDERTGDGIYTNLITVMQHQYNISKTEAIDELIRINDELVREFLALQATMPDFGPYQAAVANHVHHISLKIPGWKYCTPEMHRYDKEGIIASHVYSAIDQ